MGDIIDTDNNFNIDITNINNSSDYIETLNNDKLLNIQESILNDSRITPTGNGNPTSKPFCTQPTSGQKWWAAVILGFIFAIISSPASYYISSKATSTISNIKTIDGNGPTFLGLVIHTIIFILIVRIILW